MAERVQKLATSAPEGRETKMIVAKQGVGEKSFKTYWKQNLKYFPCRAAV